MDRFVGMSTFVKVVDNGGFSAAARRLNTTPQSVSNHIRSLEDEIGARLLNRTTRKISLTEVGRAYYERCTQILAEIEEADQIAGALHSTSRGTLRVNATTSLAPFITPVTAEYVARYPEVSIELTTTDRMVDVMEEEFDLAIRNAPIAESRLIIRRLATFRFVLCAAPKYIAAHGMPRTPADLANHNFLIFSSPPFGTEWLFKGPDGDQMVKLTGNMRCNNGATLRAAALRGQGLLITPEYTIADQLRRGWLVLVLSDYPLHEFPINAIYPHRRYLSTKVRSFIDLLGKHFGNHSSWSNLYPSD